ncbi:hypothetical protein FRB95_006244 [Tulasnella sp. JGI-2019a]|nr:hypothetical protein FRB93_006699 [Tulasnella sp. JGI-2019a]KAG9028652.1 hypothetical protein FRB95_006244 [Tulasnella sp. JGI-2019a]
MSDLASSSARKLEPFLLMAKSAKGAAAAKLIQDATSAPGVFVFAELLEVNNIQELANNPQHAPFLELLKLFSYGNYDEYKAHKDALPPLNANQLIKLKNLSIVSLASKSRILPYAHLKTYLDIGTMRELEDLIIDAMYQDVLRGRLDQKEQQLEVEYTMGRDLRPGQLEEILAALKDWSQSTAEVIAALDTKLTQIAAHVAQQKLDQETFILQRNETLQEVAAINARHRKRGGGGGGNNNQNDENEMMDIDSSGPMSNDPHGGPNAGGGFFGSILSESWKRKKPFGYGQQQQHGAGSSGGGGASSNTRKRNRG